MKLTKFDEALKKSKHPKNDVKQVNLNAADESKK